MGEPAQPHVLEPRYARWPAARYARWPAAEEGATARQEAEAVQSSSQRALTDAETGVAIILDEDVFVIDGVRCDARGRPIAEPAMVATTARTDRTDEMLDRLMSNSEWSTLREELRAAAKRSTGARVATAAAAFRKVDSLDAKRAARLATIDEATRRAAALAMGKGPPRDSEIGHDMLLSPVAPALREASAEQRGPRVDDELERKFLRNWDALG